MLLGKANYSLTPLANLKGSNLVLLISPTEHLINGRKTLPSHLARRRTEYTNALPASRGVSGTLFQYFTNFYQI
jgi:hypothetical protein